MYPLTSMTEGQNDDVSDMTEKNIVALWKCKFYWITPVLVLNIWIIYDIFECLSEVLNSWWTVFEIRFVKSIDLNSVYCN